MHQNSVHETPVSSLWFSPSTNRTGRSTSRGATGLFWTITIFSLPQKKTNTRSVDRKQIDSSLGNIVSVEATAFPINGDVETWSVTAWFRKGDITLVYFRNGF